MTAAILDLEEPIRDLGYMAGIAEKLAWELLDGDRSRVMEGDDMVIKVPPKELERVIFAIQKASDMAQELDRFYHGHE